MKVTANLKLKIPQEDDACDTPEYFKDGFEKIDVHTHDDRYYTEAEINTQMAGKASTAVATTTANGLMSKENVVTLSELSNPNLLHNGDFLNPVNSQGKTVYVHQGNTAAFITIDEWGASYTSNAKVELISTGIKITSCDSTASGARISCNFDNLVPALRGKTVSFSTKVTAVTAKKGAVTLVYIVGGVEKYRVVNITTAKIYSNTFTLPNNIEGLRMLLHGADNRTGDVQGAYTVFEWVKLEIGSNSTPFSPYEYSIRQLCAPTGYGLGGIAKDITGGDWNNAIETGWYKSNSAGTANVPLAPNNIGYGGGWVGECINFSPQYVVQIVYSFSSSTGKVYRRTKMNTVWTEWQPIEANNITVSASAPAAFLGEGFQHQKY